MSLFFQPAARCSKENTKPALLGAGYVVAMTSIAM
jgi:hypothetical protein